MVARGWEKNCWPGKINQNAKIFFLKKLHNDHYLGNYGKFSVA